MDFIETIISGVVGGLLVLLFQKYWDYRSKKLDEGENKIISPERNLKYLPKNISQHLYPGIDLVKAIEILGQPERTIEEVIIPYDYESVKAKYLKFSFLNAIVSIISKEGKQIDSITIQSMLDDKHPLELIYPLASENSILGKVLVNYEMVEQANNHFYNQTVRDAYFGIECYYGRVGKYNYFTFFGGHIEFEKFNKYLIENDPAIFLNEPIYSYSISNEEKLTIYDWII